MWTDVSLDVDGVAQKRRVFLDPVTVMAMALVRNSEQVRKAIKEGKTTNREVDEMLVDGWSAFREHIAQGPSLRISLRELMNAVASRIQLDTVPLLASYAKGLVASTSWEEPCWLHLLGYHSAEKPVAKGYSVRQELLAEEGPSLSVTDRAISEPADAGDFLRGLRDATRPTGTYAEAAARLRQIMAPLEPGTTKHYLAGWLLHLVEDAVPKVAKHEEAKRRQGPTSTKKGRKSANAPKLSTINSYRSTLASRVLNFLPERPDSLTGDELTDVFAELVDTIRSPPLRKRVADLLKRFNLYCIQNGLRIEGSYKVAKPYAAEADISARHVDEADYLGALKHLRSEQAGARGLEARVFLILAFRTGARRAEILGLTLLDVKKGNADCDLQIRPNGARAMKTSNARRRLPLRLLTDEERMEVAKLWMLRYRDAQQDLLDGGLVSAGRPYDATVTALCAETYLFLAQDGAPAAQIPDHPAASLALRALRISTGDRELHLHHLRHAFATRNVVGTLLRDLPEAALAYLPPVMAAMGASAEHFHQLVYARAGREARRGSMVSMAMGHGGDETTYRHYVHGFDLLVYAALRASRLEAHGPCAGKKAADARLRQWEAVEAARILGRSPTTRPRTKEIPVWIARRARAYGLKTLTFGGKATGRHPPLDLTWAKKQADLLELPDCPKTEVEHERARLTLALLVRLVNGSAHSVAPIVTAMAKNLDGDGWLKLPCTEAAVLRQASIDALGGTLPFEFRRAARSENQRVMVELKDESLISWLQRKDEKIWVRMKDPGGGEKPKRQRHRETIGWARAKNQADLLELSDCPKTEVEHERARPTLAMLVRLLNESAHSAAPIVTAIATHLDRDGWSELPCAEAAVLRQASVDALGGTLPFEFRRAARRKSQRVMVELKDESLISWLQRKDEKIWVRMKDPGGGEKPKRQRHRKTIGWALKVAAAHIQKFPPETLGEGAAAGTKSPPEAVPSAEASGIGPKESSGQLIDVPPSPLA